MYVLGIGGLGYKDSAAALVQDGRVLAAVAEERFTGHKHEGGFPHQAVRYCLEKADAGLRDLAAVAVADNPWLPLREKVLQWYGEAFFRSRTSHVYQVFKDEGHRLVEFLKHVEHLRGLGVPVATVPHAAAHFAHMYFGSPFPGAALLLLDGRGEVSETGTGHARGDRIESGAISHVPHSLGLLYALVADYLGYSELDDEFRLVSISPTGTPTFVERMRELVTVAADGAVRLDPDYFGYHQQRAYLSEGFTEVFGPPADPDLPLEDRHRDLAASLHALVVEIVLKLARAARERTGEARLCLGGGLAQNWALVGSICEAGIFDEVYVPPAPGDDGNAVGAALAHYHAEPGRERGPAIDRADFGPGFPEDEIARELELLKLRAVRPADLAQAAAERIASGEIVGWFQGRAEFGPRALGKRSILANPTDPATRPRLVASVKARSEFHPFGLSVTREAAGELFADPPVAPFLERTARLRPEARNRLPAVAGAGGLVRVQTVDAARAPLFHDLIARVGRRTGVPAVLNTSLNEAGRPIATTPREAIGCFFTTGLDALALGPFLLAK